MNGVVVGRKKGHRGETGRDNARRSALEGTYALEGAMVVCGVRCGLSHRDCRLNFWRLQTVQTCLGTPETSAILGSCLRRDDNTQSQPITIMNHRTFIVT
jgi:hypothetical protein